MQKPLPRRPLLGQLGGVLIWGLGASGAFAGAFFVLLAVTQWCGAVSMVADRGAGSGDFPWLATVGVAVALPFVGLILAGWTRVAIVGGRAAPPVRGAGPGWLAGWLTDLGRLNWAGCPGWPERGDAGA